MNIILRLLCAGLLGVATVTTASATNTDGTVTFTYQLVNFSGGYAPNHVDAVWVAGPNPSTNFLKSLRRDAVTRQNYLYKWNLWKKGYTPIDGISGATISSFNVTTVAWNCRDTNNAVMPDGDYKVYVEYTHGNNQGPWTTNGLAFTKGPAGVTNTYSGQQYMTGLQLVYVPTFTPHDLAALSISPSAVPANATSTIVVAVTNKTSSVESFSVVLSNLTTSTLIGTLQVSSLAGNAVTNVPFAWNTAGLLDSYTLQATAGPVSGETSTNDNTVSSAVSVQYRDIAVIGLGPPLVLGNSNATMTVTVTNETSTTESFSVVLSNLTTSALIGTRQISSLAGNTVTNVTFPWSTTNVVGPCTLQGTAGPVPNETATNDNTFSASVSVQYPHDLAALNILPANVPADATSTLRVLVTNKTSTTESFSVVLSNLTTSTLIGTQQVNSLIGNGITFVSFSWNTAGLLGSYTLGATAGPVLGETSTDDNTVSRAVLVQYIPHDLAVTGLTPTVVPGNTNATITVAVTNQTGTTETFSVVLSNLTTSTLMGTRQISSLAGNTVTNVAFQWSTTNLVGAYTLQGVAGPVANETATADNTLSASVSVQHPHDLAALSISPGTVPANTTSTIRVAVTNKTTTAENFSVVLSNLTTSTLIGTLPVSSLAGNTVTNVPFSWNTAGLLGSYTLGATAGPVAGETSPNDNSVSSAVSVQYIPHDITVSGLTPTLVQPNTNATITITVINQTSTVETFSVVLSNLTTSTLIGAQQISSLAGNTLTNVPISWNTAGLLGSYTLGATAGPVSGETSTNDNTLSSAVLVQPIPHDVAVTGLTPTLVLSNTNATIILAVTNQTSTAETFSVGLSNLTTSSLIGIQQVGPLAGNTVTNVAFQWSTTNLLGFYTLQGVAGPVSGETATADNTLSVSVSVQPMHNIAVTGLTPSFAPPNTNWTVYVNVTNQTSTAETFSVVLSNLTTSSLIGMQQVTSLAGNCGTNVPILWNTPSLAGGYAVQAAAGPVDWESVTEDNRLSANVTVRPLVHDIAIVGTTVPALVLPNTTNSVSILATNTGDFTESFTLQLFDDTQVRLISSNRVSSLVAAGATNFSILWRTTNSLYGSHTLRAVVSPVAGETNSLDNTHLVTVTVTNGWATNVFIAKGSAWRYQDQGLDLTQTPWALPSYYDSVWSQGAGPLGYSENGSLTNIATFLSWGATPINKNPACYFRQEFSADVLPSSLTLNVRCVDGVVLYLNGTELARFNMPAGAVVYTDLAASPINGPDQYTYFSSNVIPTNMVVGRNVLAAEMHKASLTASDAVLDVEMLSVLPQFPTTRRVDALSMTTGGDVLLGDRLPVTVTLTNGGGTTESVLVLLRNYMTGQVVGSQTIAAFHPTDSTSVTFDWGTLGAPGGANLLLAYTVVGGVTNFTGRYTVPSVISDSLFSTNLVNATASIGGSCSAVATAGNLLLVGAGATLEVWDNSNPVAPARVGTVRLPGLIQDIVVSGSHAYAACGNAGVQFVDLSFPALPRHRLTFNTSGHAWALAVSNHYLYVADGVAGLRIVNIVNPDAPVLVGAYYTVGPARAVALSGTRACLLDQQEGLLVLDVSNPAAPSLLGTCADFDAGQSLAVAGANAYVVDGNNHFFVVNIANPAAPTTIGSLLLANQVGRAVTLNGSTAYVAAGEDGLLAIDVATPSAPALASAIATAGQAGSLALAGSKLYVANGFAGFQIFDLTSPHSPVFQADLPTALRAVDVVVTTNDLAYVAGGESGLRIFSLANPLSPALLSRYTGVNNARAVAVSGATAYVGDGQYGLKIVDVANPRAPSLLGAYSSAGLGTIRNVGVSGSLVVVSDGRTVLLLDASTPASPSLAGTYNPTNFALSLAVDNGKVYLACGNAGLIILSVAPGGFTPVGSYVSTWSVSRVAAAGSTVYLAHPAGAWSILDVSNPATPSVIKSSTVQGPILDLAAGGNNITLACASNSLAVTLDVSVPLNPVQTAALGPLTRVLRLAATPTLVVSAEDEVGLAIFSSQIPLVLYAQRSANNSAFNLSWYSLPGKTYTIYKCTDLKEGFSLLKENISATPPLNTETDSTTSPAAFYIIGGE